MSLMITHVHPCHSSPAPRPAPSTLNNQPSTFKVKVRAHALRRAEGKCEYCGTQGFHSKDGGFYLETHHIIALCDSGRDTVDNVIALCPLHYCEAHYGLNGDALEAESIEILKRLSRRM